MSKKSLRKEHCQNNKDVVDPDPWTSDADLKPAKCPRSCKMIQILPNEKLHDPVPAK